MKFSSLIFTTTTLLTWNNYISSTIAFSLPRGPSSSLITSRSGSSYSTTTTALSLQPDTNSETTTTTTGEEESKKEEKEEQNGGFMPIVKWSDNNNDQKNDNKNENNGGLSLFSPFGGNKEPEIPEQFIVDMKWPHLVSPSLEQPSYPSGPEVLVDINRNNLGPLLAFRCLNARGAIAHGQAVTKYFTWVDVERKQKQMQKFYVRQVFEKYGGSKELRTIQDIKKELVTNGPVISISFQLTKAYYDLRSKNNQATAFVPEKAGSGSHELLIVGWELGDNGENWLVQSLVKTDNDNPANIESQISTIPIGFSQFDIDGLVLAPKSTLEDLPWQPGPYLDINFDKMKKQLEQMNGDWRDQEQLDLVVSYKELEDFLKQQYDDENDDDNNNNKDTKPDRISILDMLSPSIIGDTKGRKYLVRDQNKFAHSQYFTLRDIQYDNNAFMNKWIISVDRVNDDNEHKPLTELTG